MYRLSKAILDGPMFSKVKLLSSSKRCDEVLLANEQFEYPEGSCQPCGHEANCFAFPRVKERTIVYIWNCFLGSFEEGKPLRSQSLVLQHHEKNKNGPGVLFPALSD